MKKLLRTCYLVLTTALLTNSFASAQTGPNLITNDGFEDRYQPPHTPDNIAPQPAGQTDLTEWFRTRHNGNNRPIYVGLDGAASVNPSTMWDYYLNRYNLNFSFTPHSGRSCVIMTQHDAPADHSYNSMITLPLRTALLPGHTYKAGFWALRSVSGRYRTQLALWVTDDEPVYDYTTNTMTPAIGNKIVESPDNILNMNQWTYVSGTITIPANETRNRWVTVGYDPNADQYFDPHLDELVPAPDHVSFINYAIDDVSLVDVTPCTAVATPTINMYYHNNCGRTASFQITNYDPAYYYVVDLYGSFATIPSFSPNGDLFTLTGSPGGQGGFFTVTAHNMVCDSLAKTRGSVAFSVCDEADRSASIAYPNPANESIIIPAGVESATLMNDKGRGVRQLTPGRRLDVQSLPEGLYNLQMMQEGKLINQRIQVKH